MFIVRETGAEDLALLLDSELAAFNERHAGPRHAEPLGLTILDQDGKILAGLVGQTFWNVLHIDMLWVHAEYRHKGHGRALVEHAEKIGQQRGCEMAYLSTFDFQAPAFYVALGYSVVGELAGVPSGSRRIWFAKQLHQSSR